MSVKERKSCDCGNGNNNILGEMQTNENHKHENNMTNSEVRREMADKIKALDFSINELALYLDTHPDDEKALCLHRKYCKEVKDLKDKYQKVYGPLTINYPCNKWRWLETPWPWERGNY